MSNEPWLEHTYENEKKVNYKTFCVEKYGIKQRFIVVKTNESIKRAEKTEERRFEKEKKELKNFEKKFEKKSFSCLADLEAELMEKCKKFVYFHLQSFKTHESKTYLKKGRPTQDALAHSHYNAIELTFEEKQEVKSQKANKNSCFIIGTSDFDMPVHEIIKIYRKDQQGVERSFRFLKDPSYFADAFFLKNPKRIEALLCVMTNRFITLCSFTKETSYRIKRKKPICKKSKEKRRSTAHNEMGKYEF